MSVKIVPINWNGLWKGAANTLGWYENLYLSPAQYEARRPYFASRVGNVVTADCNDQAVIDMDLITGGRCGLEAFMYLVYPSEPNLLIQGQGVENAVFTAGMNGAWKGYQISPYNDRMRQCVLGEGYRMWWDSITAVGAGNWNVFAEAYVRKIFGGVNYLKFGTRPVWGLLDAAAFTTYVGGGNATLAATRMNYLKDYAEAQGYGRPYVVCLDSNAAAASAMNAVTVGTFDCFSRYAVAFSNASNSEYPFVASLSTPTQAAWTTLRNTGAKMMPWIPTGWDYRPRVGSDSPYVGPEVNPTSWVKRATLAELQSLVQAGKTFVETYPAACESGIMIPYSWNEHSEEDGAMCPNAGDNFGGIMNMVAAIQGAPGMPRPQVTAPFRNLIRAV